MWVFPSYEAKFLSYETFHKMMFPFFGTLGLTLILNMSKEMSAIPQVSLETTKAKYCTHNQGPHSVYILAEPMFRVIQSQLLIVSHLYSMNHRNKKRLSR